MRDFLLASGVHNAHKMKGFELLEEWIKVMVSQDPEINVFIDELAFTMSNIEEAFKCITTLMGFCRDYIWVVCKREGGFSVSDNRRYTTSLSQLKKVHGAVIPLLTLNLRSNAVVTNVAQLAALSLEEGITAHSTPAVACTYSNDNPPFVIHAPDGGYNEDKLRMAIHKGLQHMSINPLEDNSTDSLVVIIDWPDTMTYDRICRVLSGGRVARYVYRPNDITSIDECLYENCTDMLQSLQNVMNKGGILLTSPDMFSGVEAEHVMLIASSGWVSQRDASLRCVSHLVYIDLSNDGSHYNNYVFADAIDGGKL